MNELFREIEDDIKRERLDRLWRDFGKALLGLSALVVLATIVTVAVQDHRHSVAMEKTEQLDKAISLLDKNNAKDALTILSGLTNDSGAPYYGVAMLRKAQAQHKMGDDAGATQTYTTLAKGNNAFASLANMLAAGPDAGGNVIAPPGKDNPFYYSQSELRAWQLLKAGKKNEAADQFATLAFDFSGPPSIRERSMEILQQIAPDKLAQKMAATIGAKPDAGKPDTREISHDQ